MAQILDLGKLRFNWTGNWASLQDYEYNDLVVYGANLYVYVATATSSGSLPTDTSKWVLVTEGLRYRGTYTAATVYLKNDVVTDGQNTYITITAHTASQDAIDETALQIIALGQEGLPNQTSQTNKVLSTDGSTTNWASTVYLTKEYIGNAQGQAALDFENAGELTNVVSAFSGSAADFTQFALVNTTNSELASTDYIAYTADGNNTDGWIDMGITSRTFSSANFGITGPHDGYIFMSAPRGTTYEVTKKKIVGLTATITTGASHGYSVGNDIIIENVGAEFDGKKTITVVTATTIGFATTESPFTEVPLDPYGAVHKPIGNGNLVLATDGTGKENAIVFAAGGYESGTSQMSITPNDMVEIYINSPSTSADSGALVVAGGVGVGGELYVNDSVSMLTNIYLGEDAKAWEASAELTSAHIIANVDADGAPFAQFAFRNMDSAASTDIQIYNNLGTDASGWLDLGITGSDFEQAEFGITGPNEGYVFFSAPDGVGAEYAGTGNLTFATSDAGDTNAIIFAAGGFTTGRTQMAIYPDVNVHIDIDTPSTSASTGALTVIGGVGIQGDVNIAGNITFGGEGTQISTANLAVTAPLIFTGDASTSSTNDLGMVTEGKYTITNIPVATVINKQLTSNVATLTTRVAHNFAAGDSVTVASVDATYNGSYTIVGVPTTTTFTYAKTNANLASTYIGQVNYTVTNKALVSNLATLTTSITHALTIGSVVDITGVDSTFNGQYTVTAVTTNTFSYAKTATNVSTTSASGTATYYTSVSTATVSAATRTRWSGAVKKASDGVWNFVSNISTKPTTTFNYSQDTYGNGADIVYDTIKIGGLTTTGISTLAGATTVSSTLAVTSNFSVNTNKFVVTGSTGATAIAGDVAVNTDKFTVTASSGNTLAAGTITATGGFVGGSTSNITINTNKFTVAASTGNTVIAGTLGTSGLLTASAGLTVPSGQTLTSAGTLTVTGGASFTGTTDVQELREQTTDVTLGGTNTAVGTLDWTAGNIYVIDASVATAALTLNVTNLPTDASRIMTINVFITQGATGRIPSTFQIAGSGQTIKWVGGNAPTPTSSAGKIDIFSFTMQRTSAGAWIVYGVSSTNF